MNDLDLISRQALMKELEELKKSPWYCEHRDTIDGIASYQAQKEAFAIIEHEIDKAPALIKCVNTPEGLPLMDLRPHPEGEWIKDKIWGYKGCPFCGANVDDDDRNVFLDANNYSTNFCPNCGCRLHDNLDAAIEEYRNGGKT